MKKVIFAFFTVCALGFVVKNKPVVEYFHEKLISKSYEVDEKNRRQGQCLSYHLSGFLYTKTTYVNDTLNGPFEEFSIPKQLNTLTIDQIKFQEEIYAASLERQNNSHGSFLIKKGNYKKGKLEGKVYGYNANEQLTEETEYKNGMKNGLQTSYSTDAKTNFTTVTKTDYVDDKKHGVCEVVGKNLHTKSFWRNDRVDSIYTYYPSGKLQEKSLRHIEGELTSIKYREDGTKISMYHRDKVNTSLFTYDEKGKLLTEKQNGKVVYPEALPQGSREDVIIIPQKENVSGEEEIYSVVETPAQFPGGMDAMMSFIAKNVIYPAEAKEKGYTGKVYVKFVVEKDGVLSGITVIRSPHQLLSDETIRVLKLMPKWEPGKQKGVAVRTYFMFPLDFHLR